VTMWPIEVYLGTLKVALTSTANNYGSVKGQGGPDEVLRGLVRGSERAGAKAVPSLRG
jgi:hypothetical protein